MSKTSLEEDEKTIHYKNQHTRLFRSASSSIKERCVVLSEEADSIYQSAKKQQKRSFVVGFETPSKMMRHGVTNNNHFQSQIICLEVSERAASEAPNPILLRS